jgi:ligand-binding SRPBCC domain-containing protein
MRKLVMTTRLPRSPQELFPFFSDAENLGRITPPELGFEILSKPATMGEGALIDYRIGLWGIPMRWRTRIASWNPPHSFADDQLRGPYRTWHHVHDFRDDGAGGTLMTDTVAFDLPLEPLSLLALPLIQLQLGRIFRYRDAAMRKALGFPPPETSPSVRIEKV